MPRKNLLGAGAAAAVAVATVVAFTAVPAAAEPADDPLVERSRAVPEGSPGKAIGPVPGVSPRALALMTTQVELHRVADRIEAAAGSAPSPSAGLGGITVDAEHHALDLYWHGQVPAAVKREVAVAGKAGVTVNVLSAPYTLAQLRQEVDRLAALHMKGGASGATVTTIAPKLDATGLSIGVSGLRSGVAAAEDRASMARLRATVTSPVALEFEDASPGFADRWLDEPPPFWGGALAIRYGSATAPPESYLNTCSTGFGVTGLNGAATYMMFANHCRAGNWRTGWVNYSDGTQYQRTFGNTIAANDAAHDTQLILTPGGSGNAIYVGESYLGSGQPGRTVNAAARNRGGDLICTSGSYSGLVCDIRVGATGVTINVNGYGQMRDMVRADHQSARGAAGNGDSGGPVITTTGAGTTYARGTISAMDLDKFVPCYGVPAGPDDDETARHCSWRIYYPDIMDQLAGVGVRLNTG